MKPMLAKDVDLEKLSFPVLLQAKLDGIRASVVNGKLVTRTLKAVPNAEIRAALERPEFEGLDGELIVGDPTATDCYRQTVSFVMAGAKTGALWSYMVFDKWDHPGPFTDRYEAVKDIVEGVAWTDTPVALVPTLYADDASELQAMESILVDAGHEGVILRIPDSLYKFGRSGKTGPLLKLKRFSDFEAEVVGVYEEQHNGNVRVTNALGRGKRSSHAAGKTGKNALGGLILRALNGQFEGVEFRCGTGFDAAQRADLWAEWHDTPFRGRVAKVKAFPIGAHEKPRHPVFLDWRDMDLDG